MTSSVSYPIAKTFNGQWVHINDAKHGYSYYCPECESPFIARLGKIKTHHFAHKPNYVGVCTGESGYHSLAKHLLAYHYEQEGQIPLISKCTICGRNFSGKKKIINVEVEKGQNDYRPDVRLLLEDNITIDCEVIYKNPLGEKLNVYREKNSNLLIWFILGRVDKVPPFIQYKWLEAPAYNYLLSEKEKEERLLLLASSPPPKHVCSPYGIAYVIKVECYKCHRQTNVAILSLWYPMWGKTLDSGGYFGSKGYGIPYHDFVSFSEVPALFWRQLNRKYATNLFEDYSNTARSRYLMNHCTSCGAKLGDYHLKETIMEQTMENNGMFPGEKVEISFTLTEWEKGRVAEEN